ncbi:MAG: cytochrome c [Myxococcus sp.]|nr:cytochrome c [Myxococcus sp.]
MPTLLRALCLLSVSTLVACGGGTTMTPDAGPTGNASTGMTLYAARSCNGCHGSLGEGNSTGPNISGSTTAGIGAWTQAEFTRAVRESVGRDGMKLCSTMTAYPSLTDQQVADLFAFLMAQKNDTAQRGQACP